MQENDEFIMLRAHDDDFSIEAWDIDTTLT